MTPARYRATPGTSVQESFSTRAEAVERERQIKGWTRQKKEALIRGDWDLLQTLARGVVRRAHHERVRAHHERVWSA